MEDGLKHLVLQLPNISVFQILLVPPAQKDALLVLKILNLIVLKQSVINVILGTILTPEDV